MVLSGIRPSFPGLSRSAGQITHVLLTRSPLEYPASRAFPFDLHVLSTPPAFVLSQDQTLHKSNKPYKEPSPAQQKTELLTSGTKTGHPRTTPVGGPGPHAGHKNQQTENKRSIFNKQSPTCRDHPNRLHHLRLVKTWFITLLSSQTTTAHHEPQPRKTTPSRPQRPDIIYTPHHTTTNPQVRYHGPRPDNAAGDTLAHASTVPLAPAITAADASCAAACLCSRRLSSPSSTGRPASASQLERIR